MLCFIEYNFLAFFYAKGCPKVDPELLGNGDE